MVRDHGGGLPPSLDVGTSKSLGMRLIATLARQLGWEPTWQPADPGTHFVLDVLPRPDTRHEG